MQELWSQSPMFPQVRLQVAEERLVQQLVGTQMRAIIFALVRTFGFPFVSRYEDVDACFQDNESFDRAMYKPDGPYEFGKRHVFGPNILEYGNSDEHRRLRNIVAGQFVGQKLQDFLPMIDQISQEVIDRFIGEGEVELVRQFSSQVPIRVISNMMALPREVIPTARVRT